MEGTRTEPVAVVAVGAILPDAPDAATFWHNVKSGRYSITEVSPSRWDPELYYDPDPAAPDKTYSKIGGWVRDWDWEPLAWKLPIPPKVAEAMDDAQKWAVACTRAVLEDYGQGRELDRERTAVILGNAMAGELHYLTSFRIFFPEYAEILQKSPAFIALPHEVRIALLEELHAGMSAVLPPITEDTMPGELGNILAGRVANLFNFRGPNYIADAACGSAMAAVSAAVRGLGAGEFDSVITGGVDRNMGVSAFVKFCKIGALSATGTRPYAAGADGFVMGEGAGLFLLKRLADAERDGDRILAVIRSVAGSSDGKGKGITAPNPVGQRLCVEWAWKAAGESPSTATLVEGHGTSTRVGDVVEVTSLAEAFGDPSLRPGSIALGSVKSNFGHLKAASGAAGLLKTVMALSERVLPPSINFHAPNPDIDFARSPFAVNTELREWERPAGGVRRAGVSAFGFGGTNWHAVLEEYVPGRFDGGSKVVAVPEIRTAPEALSATEVDAAPQAEFAPHIQIAPKGKAPLRGAAVLGASTASGLAARLDALGREAADGGAPAFEAPLRADLAAPERLAIDFADAADLAGKAGMAAKALAANDPAVWKALRARGIFRGSGPAPKVAFLYPGQGSQYANMARILAQTEPIVAETFAEADEVMEPLLGRSLTSYLFVDPEDNAALATAEMDLMQTAITQPAVLAVDLALTRLLAAYGFEPDMVMGHSLGEYGALVTAGSLTFAHALEAVSARGREMASITVEDNGKMAAVFAPLTEVERIVEATEGYIVIANINSTQQAVIGGASDAVDRAVAAVTEAGGQAIPLPVSHAFHTSIVAPASGPLRAALIRLDIRPPRLPIVANVTGGFYPSDGDVTERLLDILARQVASPVQFVKGLGTLYDAGARVFVEVGPKRALQGFVDDVLAGRDGVASLFTNHPKVGDVASFNQALCGLYAAGLGRGRDERPVEVVVMEQERRNMEPSREPEATDRPVVITGAALGLPGTERIFDDGNVGRILRGEQLIDAIPTRLRKAILDKHITRLVKRENGDPSFETIVDEADVIRLAGRGGAFDLQEEFGVAAERMPALDRSTRLAIAAGIDALRDAGIPLVQHYKTTSLGTKLPDRWVLPEEVGDQTGVIYASAFPAYDSLLGEVNAYHRDRARRERLEELKAVRSRVPESAPVLADELDRRIVDLEGEIEAEPYRFDRRFLFKALSMGHSQFAEIIGARGPNTQINSACASTTQAIGIGEDWIRSGRCRRVIVIAADDATSDNLFEWIGSGFLASGAAATDDVVEDAATPFDRRRHGMIIGMGAAAIVLESAEAAAERGIRPICEVLGVVHANSAFHGSRLDVHHIAGVMEGLVSGAERRWGIHREEIAPEMVFVSHETYTPARGGSAAAEVEALRAVFDGAADSVVVANTKGFTGHPMGVGIEDVVALKALECGIVPPVPNYREVDPDLGTLNLSKGGAYPVRYALRLAAGFGSQIAMSLLRWVPSPDGTRTHPLQLGFVGRIADQATWNAWLSGVAGSEAPELEVVQRRLRVRDDGEALRHVEAPVPVITVIAETPKPVSEPAPVAIVEEAPVVAQVRPAVAVAEIEEAPPAVAAKPEVEAEPEVTAPAAAVSEPLKEESVRAVVLDLVAEATGYPPDMLDPELDLEADLGVDTVKQAEIFAAIRTRYDIPRDESLKLRDFPTLTHVVQFVLDRAPGATVLAETVPEPQGQVAASAPDYEIDSSAPEPPAGELTEEAVRQVVLELVAEATGYPPDMLDPELDLEADLGVDTVKQAEIFVAIRGRYDIPRDETLKLREFPTLSHVVQFVLDRAPGAVVPSAPIEIAAAPAAIEDEPPAALAQESELEVSTREAALADVTEEAVRQVVLELVAEATGYPPDMLDPELDLEADLGVDTVKQAEIFAAIRSRYDIPRDETLNLRDFPTLSHVVQFVLDRAPHPDGDGPGGGIPVAPAIFDPVPAPTSNQLEPAPNGQPSSPATVERERPTTARAFDPARALAGLEAADAIPRRVAVPVMRPSLDHTAPTGVEIGPGSRIVVMADTGGVAKELVWLLEERGAEVLLIDKEPDAEALAATIDEWAAAGPPSGVFWLPALDPEGPIGSMDLAGWKEALRVRVKLLYATARTLYDDLARPGAFLVAATRLGGFHGYDDAGAAAPLGGAVTGFTKALKRERETATVKAVDVETDASAAQVAEALVEEALRDPGCVEVGHANGLRWAVTLDERPAADGADGLALGPDSVIAVTGAAGSIVSAIVADLAAATGASFHLLDLAPEPDPADPDIARFAQDREGLKRDLVERAKQAGERPTPIMIDRQLAALERSHAALSAIRAVEAAGGTARYHQLDLTDADAVAAAVDDIREEHGRIDALLHAAGLEISRFLPDKEPREFDLVFDVKSNGWFNLLHAIGDIPLGAAVVFSSVAGRFGNGGQTDYSSANDLLCKSVSSFRRTRPGTRGIAIDWTAWAGIGMASRGSIPKMMEAAGIDMLPPEAGIPVIRRELVSGGFRGEIVVGGRLGILLQEWDDRGGIDPEAFVTGSAGPVAGTVVSMGVHEGLRTEVVLDPARQPFLDHHRIDGIPVLPGVMGIETFAEGAAAALPGWHVTAVEDVRFLAPLKCYRDEPRTVAVEARFRPDGDDVVAEGRLVGSRRIPGHNEPQTTTHFTANVRLSREAAAAETREAPDPEGGSVGAEDVYRVYFHGPAYRVLERAWPSEAPIGLLSNDLPPNHRPDGLPLVAAPRLIELCFQTAGMWELCALGRFALPTEVGRVRLLADPATAEGRIRALVHPSEDGARFDAWVEDDAGTVILSLEGYRTVELPGALDPAALEALRAAVR